MKAYAIDTSKYTEEQIMALANSKGYQEKVLEENTETKQFEEKDNSQAPIDFIAQEFKTMADVWLAGNSVRDIKQSFREQQREAITALQAGIASTTEIKEV